MGLSALALLPATVAVTVAVRMGAPLLVGALSGDADFGGGALVLQRLVVAYPFMSLTMLFSLALIAANRQGAVAAGLGVVAAVHVLAVLTYVADLGVTVVIYGLVGGYALLAAFGLALILTLKPAPLPGPAVRVLSGAE